mgnify:FL=1
MMDRHEFIFDQRGEGFAQCWHAHADMLGDLLHSAGMAGEGYNARLVVGVAGKKRIDGKTHVTDDGQHLIDDRVIDPGETFVGLDATRHCGHFISPHVALVAQNFFQCP